MKKAVLREYLKNRENALKIENIVQNAPIKEKKTLKKGKKGEK